MKKTDFTISLAQRLLLLFFLFLICYIVTALLSMLVSHLLAGKLAASLRMNAMCQDVIAFITPSIVTALIATRRPAQLLCLNAVRSPLVFILLGLFLFVSIPFQEAIIYWNYNIELPGSMDSFANMARHLEDTAFSYMKTLLENDSIGTLIINILVIGIAAGFAEELLFRGCFQRLLTTAGINVHVAIWVVAFVFSAFHFQFYGFVPRLLLGAYFGYLLLWSGSIWVPVTAHILNNTIYAVTSWIQVRNHGIASLSNEPSLWSPAMTIGSFVLTIATLYLIHRFCSSTSAVKKYHSEK